MWITCIVIIIVSVILTLGLLGQFDNDKDNPFKNKILNKLISVFGLFLIFSCGNSEYKGYDNKVQSTWIIHEIDYESATTTTYYAKTTDTTDLNEVNTWFADTIGAFKAGDTLIFAQKQFKNGK